MSAFARRACLVLLGPLAVAALPRPALAQAATALLVSATVDNTALSVSNTLNLQFGTLVPGTPTTIDPKTSVNAGQFVVHGARNAEVSVTMTLPAALTVGPYSIPLTFGANGGCYRRQSGQANCTYWDPSTVLVSRIRNANPPNNHLWIWIGGTASPSPTQRGGVYHATIGLTVVYTGN